MGVYMKELHARLKDGRLGEAAERLGDIAVALDQSAIVAITDKAGMITYVNEAFCEISQYTREELIGTTHRLINSGYHSKSFFEDMWSTIRSGMPWRGEIRNRAKDGSFYWVDTKIVPFVREDGGAPYQYISIRYDVTERKRMEQKVMDNAELYRIITENASDMISVVDATGGFHYISPSHTKMIGRSLSAGEDTLLSLVHPDDQETIRRTLESIQAGATGLGCQVRTEGTEKRFLEMTFNLIQEPGRYFRQTVVVIRDVTERKRTEELIDSLEHIDQLTSLLNRGAFRTRLLQKTEEARRMGNRFCLVYLNIDRLRYVNESFGHEVGDRLLMTLAAKLRDLLPPGDLIGRNSGDEFVFTFSEVAGEKAPETAIQAIKEELERPLVVDGGTYSISTSYGIALYPEHGDTISGLIKNAEKALHFVKAQGGSGYKIYQPETEQKTIERILLESELRKSVQQEYFTLEYQPKMNLARGDMMGVEALVRWDHPELGRIRPDKFIPLAEETRLIVPLGEWIFREACKQARKWEDEGYPPIRMGINMSTVQLEEPGVVSMIERIIEDTGMDPVLLEIELTESSFADTDDMRGTLQMIRDLGITVAIDDFGTGYSNFSYIKELPADTLKIDMSFVRDILVSNNSRAIVKAIITIAETAGLAVIAEGIETEEQAKLLLNLGCQEGQGYFYSKPLPADQCVSMMMLNKVPLHE